MKLPKSHCCRFLCLSVTPVEDDLAEVKLMAVYETVEDRQFNVFVPDAVLVLTLRNPLHTFFVPHHVYFFDCWPNDK